METEDIIRLYFRQGLTYQEVVAVLRNSNEISLRERNRKFQKFLRASRSLTSVILLQRSPFQTISV